MPILSYAIEIQLDLLGIAPKVAKAQIRRVEVEIGIR
jgi:hypothetical protein